MPVGGSGAGGSGGGSGSGSGVHGDGLARYFLSRVGIASGAGGGAGSAAHDLTARSMGYPMRGATGTSFPSRVGDEDDPDGAPEASSYNAASFSLGGSSSGNYVVSDFGYALQRPAMRYEDAYRQSPPLGHGPRGSGHHHMGPSSMRLSALHGRAPSTMAPGMAHRASLASYTQPLNEPLRGHERGTRALSMDQTQTAPLHYYMGTGASAGGGLGGQLPGVGGRFSLQSLRYPGTAHQASSMSSAAPAAPPPGYTPLAGGGFVAAPSSGFRGEAPPQGSVPWVRAGRGIAQSNQSLPGGPRAQSTSPLFGRCGEERGEGRGGEGEVGGGFAIKVEVLPRVFSRPHRLCHSSRLIPFSGYLLVFFGGVLAS